MSAIETRDDGGPVFPCSADQVARGFEGLRMRDLIAIFAPPSPTFGFHPQMPYPRPTACEPIDCNGYPANARAIEEWDQRFADETAKQWPYVWADAMLAARRRP